MNTNIEFQMPKNQSSTIKVLGVGGGGSNAVNYMYTNGIKGVDFVVCNTDSQALEASPVPTKIQLGVSLTEGLGAGSNPDTGKKAAEESIDKVVELLDANTKMLFITAGMGGGTGTGAAPVIAEVAREKGILTVAVVTNPFSTEGGYRKQYAKEGLNELRRFVDTLLIINNDKLIEVYGDLTLSQAFGKANEVLNTATKGIAEVISQHLLVNIDLNDAKKVLENSGTAVMGQSESSGENRAIEAVEGALDSPLLNDNDISGAEQVLLKIVTGSGEDEIKMSELNKIKNKIQEAAGNDVNIIEGIGIDSELGSAVSVTVIATGFEQKIERGPVKINLEENMKLEDAFSNEVENKEISIGEQQKLTLDDESISHENKIKDLEIISEKKINTDLEVCNENKIIFSLDETIEEDDEGIENPDILISSIQKEINQIEDNVEESEKNIFTNKNNLNNENDEFILHEMNTQIEEYSEVEENTDVENTDMENTDMENTDIENIDVENTDMENTDVENTDMENTDVENTDVENTDVENTDVENTEEVIEDSINTNIESKQLNNEKLHIEAREREERLRIISKKLRTPSGLTDLEDEPAYKRKDIKLEESPHSSDNEVSVYTLNEGSDKKINLKPNNPFLHDNVD